MSIYKAIIPGEPTTKKNSQKIIKNPKTERPMIIQSDKYRLYEKVAGYYLPKLERPISEAVNVRCIFYRSTRRRFDLTNGLEAIHDILVKYGVLSDDNFDIVAGVDGSRVFIDKEHPRVEIYIDPLKDMTLKTFLYCTADIIEQYPDYSDWVRMELAQKIATRIMKAAKVTKTYDANCNAYKFEATLNIIRSDEEGPT